MCVIQKETKNDAIKAGKNFVAKMKDSVFVTALLSDAGVNHPPCFCCLHQIQKTCVHSVGESNCTDYVLYSESPAKVERKFLNYVNITHQQRSRQQRLAA